MDLEEALAQADVYDVVGMVDDIISIDPTTRTINIPDSETTFGVETDMDVERKYFRCPRIVGDNIDLYAHKIYVVYVTAKDVKGTFLPDIANGKYWCDDVAVDGDCITFSWLLSKNVLSRAGIIAFKVLAVTTENGKEKTRWNTAPAYGTILMTVQDGDDIEERYPDIVTQLLDRMDAVESIATEEAMKGYVAEYLGEHPVQLDETLTDNTKAAPAGVVGELKGEIDDLKDNGTSTGTGLSSEIKSALMTVVENIGLWKDENGQTYIDNLRTSLYNAPLASISAVYTQSGTVYASDSLESLKEDLVVTGTYTDGSSAIVTDYSLSGSLVAGTSTVTVTKDGKTAKFTVTVTAARVAATGITLDVTTLSLTSSSAVQLTATVTPSNSTDTVVWSSSEGAVATVENGLVTPVSDGSCTIYATAGDFTAECSVSVALPLNGVNIGNPYLMNVSGMPSSVASTEEEAQGNWYRALFTSWTSALGVEITVFLHPFSEGTYYIRMLGRTLSEPIVFYAFENDDIGMNPTTTLGKVGDTYTDATVTKFTTFDWTDYAGNEKSSTVELGEWEYVDESGTTYTGSFVTLYKLVVPENAYVFMCTHEMDANKFPGISENYPYMNDLYTIFDSDPSANILQVVE